MQAQYIFIHDALLEAIECGVTEVNARDLPVIFKKLCTSEGLEKEYKRLSSSMHNVIAKSISLTPGNKTKNRYNNKQLMPCEWSCNS